MNTKTATPVAKTTTVATAPAKQTLQRQCACGNHTTSGGECTNCAQKKLQKKLSIGATNDPLELEADRVAEQVLAYQPAHSFSNISAPKIQRRAEQSSPQTEEVPASVERVLAGSGSPLPITVRKDMEQRFGQDFSQVRMHTGSTAEQSASDVSANAYTVGNNIVFSRGKFSPETHSGKRLLAHELTHVVQQTGSGGARFDRTEEKNSVSPIIDKQSSIMLIQGKATPELQRSSSGKEGRGYEAGAIGSLQVCINFCNGDIELIGWVWAGAGTRVLKTFVGPSVMYEGTLAKTNVPSLSLLKSICGECDPKCDSKEDSGLAGGIPFFGDVLKKGGSKKMSLASLECGVLVVPHSMCNVDIELICFANLLPYMGALGKSLTTLGDKIGAEAKAGIDGGVTLEFCKGANGNWVMPKAQVCFGGFVEFGWVKEPPPGKSPPKKSAPSKDPAPPKPEPSKVPQVEPLDPKLIV